MSTNAFRQTTADPLAGFTLDTLLEGAARLRPDAVALLASAGQQAMTFSDLMLGASRFAARLEASGCGAGDTMLLLAGARNRAIVALLGGMRAGIDVLLVPPQIELAQIVGLARQSEARILIAGEKYNGLNLVEKAFATAAITATIRLVGALDGGDDAADFSAAALANEPVSKSQPAARPPCIFTLATLEGRVQPIAHSQRMLVVATLDLIQSAQFTASQPILSTLATHTLAGLVSGPLASLLCGASVLLHGSFNSQALLSQLAAHPQAQVIVPAAMLSALAEAELLQPTQLTGVVAWSRWDTRGLDFIPPATVSSHVPITDLHGFGEMALVPEARGTSGQAQALLDPAHEVEIGGTILLAVDADDAADGGMDFFGAGVTATE